MSEPEFFKEGYVYILINASLQKNTLKIGMTKRTPEIRAEEMSDETGLPSEYIVAHERKVSDCEEAEAQIHDRLKRYRITHSRSDRSREFFIIPFKRARPIFDEIADQFKPDIPKTEGYVYILINASLQKNTLKIGVTRRTPQIRADELSEETGLPSEYVVAHNRKILDCEKVKALIHARLRDHRITNTRYDRSAELFDQRQLEFPISDNQNSPFNKNPYFSKAVIEVTYTYLERGGEVVVTDKQVRRMMKMVETGKTQEMASLQTGMDRKTARKYLQLGRLPSEVEKEHNWRTRTDPFEEVWDEVLEKLEPFPRLEAKTLFDFLQQEYPGRFTDGQLRTLQRRVKVWRALEGPGKEVFFPQEHHPGVLSESDYTRMGKLGITIQRQPFDHMVYHFVLTYSNWETGNVCFSESYESLSAGLQNALWKLGGVPKTHKTDSLSSAVNNLNEKEQFTQRYKGLLKHYGLKGQKTQAGKGNENGDVEQGHHRLKRALDQALLLRGSRDFESREDYEKFLKEMFDQLNKGRQDRFAEELRVLKALPARRLEDCKKLQVSVGPSSTIRVLHNRYSVHSRLIGEKVQVRAYAEWLDVWYGQRRVDRLPRLQGKENHRIDYRHIIDWLVRKPGAFANYRYRDDLFPTSRFRIAYDILKDERPVKAGREYLKILHLAAKESESAVDRTLGMLLDSESPIRAEEIKNLVCQVQQPEQVKDPIIVEINLQIYDSLLEEMEVIHE